MKNNNTQVLDLISTIASRPELSTFSQILAASGLEDILAYGGEFTIFAPNNGAFRKLEPRRLLHLLNDLDRTAVRTLVLFHVCMGRMHVAEQGTPDNAAAIYSSISALDADMDTRNRNIAASNGLIHEIGRVLTPATSPCGQGQISCDP